jgi:DNA-binding response OmpR family regulator
VSISERIAAETNTAAALGDVVVLCAQEEVRDVIAYWLRHAPVRAFVADDGYHANRILQTLDSGVLITDRMIPPWPGLDTFMSIRARHPGLQIVFVDNGSNSDRILARVTGGATLLSRPLTRNAVIDVVSARKSHP